VTELLYASHAPAFEVDGELQRSLARDLLRLEVEETTEGLKTLRARLVNVGPRAGEDEGLLYLDGDVLDFGKELVVSLGPEGEERIVFKGRISALEAVFVESSEPELWVYAEDALMKLRMTRRSKTYERMSDAEIAAAIAAEHGLTPETQADGPTYDVVQQADQSDLAFLRERARLIAAELWADGDTLCFKTRQHRTGTELTLVRGNELIEARVRADLAHQRTKVRVSGYDAAERAVIDEEAGEEAVLGETSGGRTGVAILRQALGERATRLSRLAPLTGPEAQAWAKAELLRRARAFATIVGATSGTPDLVVGSRLTLERVGPPFEGSGWYATRVRHVYDLENGHRTHFEAERPTVGS
jgi:phage protein D